MTPFSLISSILVMARRSWTVLTSGKSVVREDLVPDVAVPGLVSGAPNGNLSFEKPDIFGCQLMCACHACCGLLLCDKGFLASLQRFSRKWIDPWP
jgi:hypothetical protein